ncbi:MAG: UDP-N-acetylmuramate dehydrogenase [Treponema sp.]|jgi:UDP-N-acetylmuramate dehydrogenase|nr:UDP-N-acetylmuramate dehydrogenase [Treponema sp.]
MIKPLFTGESSPPGSSLVEKSRRIVERCRREFPCEADIRYAEPMAAHTTFRAGGPADCWLRPFGEGFPAFAVALKRTAQREGVPFFTLGGGANLVAADRGVRGIVLDTSGWTGVQAAEQGRLIFRSGTSLDEAAETAAAAGLSGLEFLAGMPGSIGGAVWMNARCYGREIADVLLETEILEGPDFAPIPESGPACGLPLARIPLDRSSFGYKKSPFQNRNCIILSAAFALAQGDESEIRATMDACRQDRTAKGHYRYPSAGSVFKNNRDFGKPAGQIIDELGLRGLCRGGAQVAPYHGNIIVNTGEASASDIRALVDEVAVRVKAAAGFALECEILFVGDW